MTTVETAAPAVVVPNAETPVVTKMKKAAPQYVEVPVRDIITRAGENVRTGELPDIEGLAASIAAEGLLEPILITQAVDSAGKELPGKFTVVAGHRRLTAVRSLGLPTISALIIDADADRRLKLALIENIQREDMAPLDKAKGIAKLLKNTKLEQKEIAQALGVAPGYISQYMALLDLPEAALNDLSEGKLSFTQARTLCRLLPNVKAIEDLLFEASELTVSALDAKVAHLVAADHKVAAEAEEAEEAATGTKTKKKKVKAPPSEKEIAYYTDADFHPLKKDDIRDLMVTYKRKEVNADDAAKREEYRLILKGITLAADLRFK